METSRAMLNSLASTIKFAKGLIGYFRFPDQKISWGGAFNGQEHRVKVFWELHKTFEFRTIVETGTYRGSTTALFLSVPHVHVYTIEAHPWSYGYCRARFFLNSKVTLLGGDSRENLGRLTKIRELARPAFFYLDAHWDDDLPLRTELETILSTWPDAVVMIDDFEVEGDTQYGFDDYGPMKRINMDYIAGIIQKFSPILYFPSIKADMESGARRGSIVLVGRQHSQRATSFSTLRRHLPRS